jgi:Rrf2 family protein
MLRIFCMRLRSQVEHAVLCCLLMIGLGDGEALSAKSMAALYEMPKEYLAKTLQALSRAGIVRSSQGMSGGYRLSREPTDIRLLEIVEAIEGDIATFKQSRRIERLLLGNQTPGAGSVLARSFGAADSLWCEALSASNLGNLANELGLSPRAISDARSRAISA